MKPKFLFICVILLMDIHVAYCHFDHHIDNKVQVYRGASNIQNGKLPLPLVRTHKKPISPLQFERVSAARFPIDRQDLGFLHAYTASNLSPVKHANPGGFFSILMNGSENDLDNALSQNAVLDTIADLLAIIGLKDLRDWLGIILMMFLLGPVLIPIVMLPAPTLAMGALLVPLIWNSPPSAVNDNVAGHDPIGAQGRSMPNDATLLSGPNDSRCVEMFTCEIRELVGKFTSSDPVSRIPRYEEDCSEYKCRILSPVQTFLSSYYFYIFGDGTKLCND